MSQMPLWTCKSSLQCTLHFLFFTELSPKLLNLHTLTLAMVKGWLKSRPPISRKPHGAGPSSTTVNGISTAGVCACVCVSSVMVNSTLNPLEEIEDHSSRVLALSLALYCSFLSHFFFHNALPSLSFCSSWFPSQLPLLLSTKISFYLLHFCATFSPITS